MEYKNGENRIYAVNDEGVEVGEVTLCQLGKICLLLTILAWMMRLVVKE